MQMTYSAPLASCAISKYKLVDSHSTLTGGVISGITTKVTGSLNVSPPKDNNGLTPTEALEHQLNKIMFQNQSHNIIPGMITERHNVACRLIMKAISKGSLAGCIIHMDAGSNDRFAQQNLQIPEHARNTASPIWLFDARLSVKTGLLPVALMLFWLLRYPLILNHLALRTCNRCSMLDLMDKCAELSSLTLIRGRYTS